MSDGRERHATGRAPEGATGREETDDATDAAPPPPRSPFEGGGSGHVAGGAGASGSRVPGPEASGADAGGGPGSPGAPGEGFADGLEPILPDVAAITAERDEYLHALQRLKADFENYRKRVARLEEEQAARAAGDVVRKLLPVLDHLDLALVHLQVDRASPGAAADDGGAPDAVVAADGADGADGAEQQARQVDEVVRALVQTRRDLLDVLSREGLERVDDAGVPFDPTVHDAVAHAPAATDEPASAGSAATGSGEQEPGTNGTSNGTSADGARTTSVDEVMRAGYRWRGQVLRPAMVRVRD